MRRGTKRRKSVRDARPERFDAGRMSDDDRELLAEFVRRRAEFERAMAASNIIHHKHTCPACGFPTLSERYDYEICVVCLWEDGTGEEDPGVVGLPNSISLTEARIHAAGLMRAFERANVVEDGFDEIVRNIKRFEERLRRREAKLDREDFAANLRGILRTRPREG
jgi:hypothetical protein